MKGDKLGIFYKGGENRDKEISISKRTNDVRLCQGDIIVFYMIA
jgi:hypothetical protein